MRTMKAAVWEAPGRIVVRRIPLPSVGRSGALVKVGASGICGSDVHSYTHGFYVKPGQVLGHEFAGTVVEVGPQVVGFEVGDAVTGFHAGACGTCYWCQRNDYHMCPELYLNSTGYGRPGSMAEYVLMPDVTQGASLIRLPNGLDLELGATVEPTATAASAVQEVRAGDKVVVLGAGFIGNVAMQAAKAAGAAKVVVSEISPLRLEAAKAMGADSVFDARTGDALEWVKETVGIGRYHFGEGGMADVVIEAAGAPSTVVGSLEMVRSRGTVVFVGLPERPAPIDTTKIIHKGPKIVGVLGGSYQVASDLISSGKVATRPLITHRFSLDDAPEAFEVSTRPEVSIKVMVLP